jgi:hypothetical protein
MLIEYKVGNTTLDAASMAAFINHAAQGDNVARINASAWASDHMVIVEPDGSNAANTNYYEGSAGCPDWMCV